MRSTRTKLLLVCLDAADRNLLLEWAGAGALPTLAQLLESCAWGTSSPPPGLYVGAIWPSFYTSVGPDRHGRYCYRQLRPGSYEIERVRPTDVVGEPFWCQISRQGKRVAVIDVPKAPLTPDLHGLQVVDWGTHDPDLFEVSTWPPGLAAELVERFGSDPVGDCDAFRGTAPEFEALVQALEDRIRRKVDLTTHLLRQGDWDAFIVAFAESHCIGHQAWHLHDSEHPRHDARIAGLPGDPLRRVYVALDRALGRVIEEAGPEARVIVLASHGFGPHYDGDALLDEILLRLEPAPVRWRARLRDGLRRLEGRAPGLLRRGLTRRFPALRAAIERRGLADRRSFAIPNNEVYGAIRVNLRGREPQGRVAREDLRGYLGELCEALSELRNAESGEPLIEEFMQTADTYEGPLLGQLPDLMVRWNKRAPIETAWSPRLGRIHRPYLGCRTGDHSPDGLFLLKAPRVAPGPLDTPVSIMDFAPTVAEALGVELPEAEGRSIWSCLERDGDGVNATGAS